MKGYKFIFVILCHFLISSESTAGESVCSEVKTLNGVIRGKQIRTATGKDVCVFTGIPYGVPPLKELRFKKPVPIGNWEGVLDATKLPNSCIQLTVARFFKNTEDVFPGGKIWDANTPISEDCLYLNVWVPVSILEKKEESKSTVMFWIYGGGFVTGTTTLDIYNGSVLAGEENIIVVSTQYRVGTMGYLYFGHNEAPGNVGFLDQRLALEWTNDNIGNFGGNYEDITLFGQSGGAFSISYHMLSSGSKHLFKRAILMAGSSNAPLVFEQQTDALKTSYGIAESLGCFDKEQQTPIPDIVNCMREIDADDMRMFGINKKPDRFASLAASITVDGEFLTDTPENLLKNGHGKRTDIIIGTVSEEGSFLLHYDIPKYFPNDKPLPITRDHFVTIMRRMFRHKPKYEQDAIISEYTNWENFDDSLENQRNIIKAAGDPTFLCPTTEYAKIWSARGLKAYYYLFNQVASNDPWGKWTGVKHGDECEFAFGRPLEDPKRTDGEKEVSRKFMKLLANFARTGIPSKMWEPHTAAYPVYLELNGTIVSETSTPNRFGPRAEKCNFWNNELPKLRKFAEQRQGRTQDTCEDTMN